MNSSAENRFGKKTKTGGRTRFAALLLALVLFACVLPQAPLPVPGSAQASAVCTPASDCSPASASSALAVSDAESLARAWFSDVLTYLQASLGATSANPQTLIDEKLSDADGFLRNLWFLFALSQQGSYDFRATQKALFGTLAYYSVPPRGTELEKFALLSLAIGDSAAERYDSASLGEAVGSQGIMSLVFGLHLQNNGLLLPGLTAEETVREILALQLPDGGWAISGQYGDVDVTSMVLQALAPYCKAAKSPAAGSGASDRVIAGDIDSSPDSSVVSDACAAIDRALTLLSERQLSSGGFQSYGAANCESCAQVLVALSACGIDAASDPRFLKDGRSLFDAIASFRLPDGSFRHIATGESNLTATQQVFYACVAYLRFREGRPSLYELDAVREGRTIAPSPTAPPDGTPTPADGTPTPAGGTPTPEDGTLTPGGTPTPVGNQTPDSASRDSEKNSPSGIPAYRLIGTAAIVLLALISLAILALRKRITRRNAMVVAFAACVILLLLWVVKIQTPQQYYDSLKVSEKDAVGTVTLSIRCDTVAGENGLPADGVLLAPVRVPFKEGDTVYTALVIAAADAGLPLDTSVASGGYIRGIGALHEFDFGSLSGWMYYVNGEAPSESSGAHPLRDGDVIEWRYTRNLGEDTAP
ncbi:MAG: DUF4430 domain-containing protein [Lachnospiraceae bacterium]|nr:DUF4430 domain-containing protein [Lachnospiraceae bacterium]